MSAPGAEQLRRTPLYDAHVKAGAKMVPFGGWEMPLHYGSQIEEHLNTRKAVSLFDVSHMGEVEVTGADALALIQEIVTQDASTLGDGDEVYTVMCREDGGLIDDLIVTRFGPEEYFLVVNAGTYDKDVAAMQAVAERLKLPAARLRPCAEEWAMIAVQGPRWAGACEAAIGAGPWQGLKSFKAIKMEYGAEDLIVSITGYTGEPGAELICRPSVAIALWDALCAAGARPAGLAARDTLRLEKGYCLSGQDFTEENNPYEIVLGRVVKLGKPSFTGRAVLEKIKAEGPKQKLMGLLPQGRRMARHGAAVIVDGQTIGTVTSGGFGPSLGAPIALAYLKTEFAEKGREVEIDLGRTTTTATVVRPPFYPPKSN